MFGSVKTISVNIIYIDRFGARWSRKEKFVTFFLNASYRRSNLEKCRKFSLKILKKKRFEKFSKFHLSSFFVRDSRGKIDN